MLVIYSFLIYLLRISVYSLFFIFLTLLFLFQIVFFLCILSFLLLCLFYYFVFPHSLFPVILSLCHSVSSLSFCLFSSFCRTSFPLFSFSFWLHFYPFTCLFFDIFAWIFKYIKILLSFYFFVCLSTLFLFSFIIYVIDFLI